MTWRTGTKNPHTLYLDEGEVSIPQGFIMNPGAARAIVEAMNARDATPRELEARCLKLADDYSRIELAYHAIQSELAQVDRATAGRSTAPLVHFLRRAEKAEAELRALHEHVVTLRQAQTDNVTYWHNRTTEAETRIRLVNAALFAYTEGKVDNLYHAISMAVQGKETT